ncbi:hypothetical protein BDK51DRAFT_29609, partial [Blyttiomyces helicus]
PAGSPLPRRHRRTLWKPPIVRTATKSTNKIIEAAKRKAKKDAAASGVEDANKRDPHSKKIKTSLDSDPEEVAKELINKWLMAKDKMKAEQQANWYRSFQLGSASKINPMFSPDHAGDDRLLWFKSVPPALELGLSSPSNGSVEV